MPVHPLVAARFPLIDGIPVPLIDGIPDFDESLNKPELTERYLTYTAPYSAYSMPDVQIEDPDDRRAAGRHPDQAVPAENW